MTSIKTYRINLGWSYRKMASEAKLAPYSIKRAEEGYPVKPSTAKAIADALSKATKTKIRPLDIDGLNIQ
jgi:transcriptional regulator with XRE-family HTH domain